MFYKQTLIFLKIFAQLKEIQYYPLDEIQTIQNNYLSKLLYHAYENVPYYKPLLKSFKFEKNTTLTPLNLTEIPVLDKSILKEEFKNLRSKDASHRYSYTNFSGGSTGVPSKFIQDRHFHNYAMAHTYLVHSWYPVDPFERRLNIWGAGRDMDTSLKGRLKISSKTVLF